MTKPTTAECIAWLDAADKSPLLTPRVASLISALRAQLLAALEMAKALDFYSDPFNYCCDDMSFEIPVLEIGHERAKTAQIAWIEAGGQ